MQPYEKYLSVVPGIILTDCLVACGSFGKDLVDEQDEEIISNQEVSDIEAHETSAEQQSIWFKFITERASIFSCI